ncbi:class I SAM-dependent methyltransferase [Fontibacillus sp. BL9]|uniref:class I SAM-dependent methyltransferase n=1 Tax=Fontibacillus sp. BL9 TaxID=3389971 RepID=UPI00397BBFAA
MDTFSSIISALFFVLGISALLSIVITSWRNGISPTPTSVPVRHAAMAELRRIGGITNIVEAGSGWGTLALQAAKINPSWNIVGIENSHIPLAVSRLTARWSSVRNVSFIRGDLYKYPYGKADAVICYLFPGAMKRLDPLFREELTAGTSVISICFALPGWTPDRIVTCRDMYRTKIYIYKK